jgi:hypothetical protein
MACAESPVIGQGIELLDSHGRQLIGLPGGRATDLAPYTGAFTWSSGQASQSAKCANETLIAGRTCDDPSTWADPVGAGAYSRGELSVVFVGFRYHFRTSGQGILHCYRCGGDRDYRQCAGRRWFHLLFVPVIALERVDEHVQCTTCGTRYRSEVLAMPTTAQMRAALPAATRAAVVAMVRAGDSRSAAARACAIERIRVSGMPDYGDVALAADIGRSDAAGSNLASALGMLAVQLTMPAHEWFLADVVRVGLADGPLSDEERCAARDIAACLGMTQAQARGVISMTEESAAAG